MSEHRVEMKFDFLATIHFFTTAEGGRRGFVASGYRVLLDLGHPDGLCDSSHCFPNTERVEPGDTVQANVTLLSPQLNFGRLYVGMPFTVQEGSKVVGHGTITEIVNPRLRASESG